MPLGRVECLAFLREVRDIDRELSLLLLSNPDVVADIRSLAPRVRFYGKVLRSSLPVRRPAAPNIAYPRSYAPTGAPFACGLLGPESRCNTCP